MWPLNPKFNEFLKIALGGKERLKILRIFQLKVSKAEAAIIDPTRNDDYLIRNPIFGHM